MKEIINNKSKNQYLSYSLLDLRIAISKKQLQSGNKKFTFQWIADKLNKSKSAISFVLNDTNDLSSEVKNKLRKRICTLLKNDDSKNLN